MSERENILVIKLGALGDFIQALGAMRAIRHHHPQARITLLTSEAYAEIAQHSGYFDGALFDNRPKFYQLRAWAALYSALNAGNFTRVYDLQNNDRTSVYFKLFKKSNVPEWVGVAPGASHRNTSPERTAGPALDGHRQTLSLAGVENVTLDTLSWMKADVARFDLPESYALFVPGCSPHHPEKRWPARQYAALGTHLLQSGITPLILGTMAENPIAKEILDTCPHAINLMGKTSLFDLAALARGARVVVGNDTGPLHLIAATGAVSIVLFSRKSDSKRHAPQGAAVTVLQEDSLGDMEIERVIAALPKL